MTITIPVFDGMGWAFALLALAALPLLLRWVRSFFW
jgi:hypothetical protein